VPSSSRSTREWTRSKLTWSRDDHKLLWRDILEQYDHLSHDEQATTHFICSFVFSPLGGAASEPVSSYLVVDGQQRITTLMLILCVLPDIASKTNAQATERSSCGLGSLEKRRLLDEPRALLQPDACRASQRGCAKVVARHPSQVYVVSAMRVHREALSQALESRGLRVVGVAATVGGLIHDMADLRPDIALVDMSTADAAAVRRIRAEARRPKVVAVGLGETGDEFLPCAEAGISGYVPQEGSLKDLVISIEGVASGEARLPPHVGAQLLERVAALAAEPLRACESTELTVREVQILELVQDGLSNKEIAVRLQIELPTVKNHVHSILTKLGVRSRAQAAARTRRSI
jgi:two-component system nitrate/nitrite response regulator NarL